MSDINCSGSYASELVTFLLRPLKMELTDVAEKERLIQSGEKHYSEMLSKESLPSEKHLQTYELAMKQGALRMATDVITLAKKMIDEANGREIVLASLVRAGVPLAVCLKRALSFLGTESTHYGISIIRDRGLCNKAMDKIESMHDKENIYFIDGWTGKGAISGQLKKSLKERGGYGNDPKLVVLADPCGKAWMSASYDDWLLPFGIMGATISGLVSRTVWKEDDYHGFMYYDEMKSSDVSQKFSDDIALLFEEVVGKSLATQVDLHISPEKLAVDCDEMVTELSDKYSVDSINRIKPGVAEATRAVMRRVPDHVLVKDINDPDVSLLLHLTAAAGVKITEEPSLLGNFKAITIIKKVK